MITFGLIAGVGSVAYSCGPAQVLGIPMAIKNKVQARKLRKEKEKLVKQSTENKEKGVQNDYLVDSRLRYIDADIVECHEAAKKHLVSMVPVVGTIIAQTAI
jgi:hypothetical protein